MATPPTGPETPGLADDSIEAVAARVSACTRCGLSATRTNAVPGDGSRSPSIMFIGEGPGSNEDQQGLPFVGRAGQLLDSLLRLIPVERSDVYITNIVKCRPPDNRDPYPEETAACRPFLERQIDLLRPRVIATLGRHSLNYFLPGARIGDVHGRPTRWRDIILFPLYHPAAGLRSSTLRQTLEEDVRRLPEAILRSLSLGAGAVTIDTTARAATPVQGAPASDLSTGPEPGEDQDRQRRLF